MRVALIGLLVVLACDGSDYGSQKVAPPNAGLAAQKLRRIQAIAKDQGWSFNVGMTTVLGRTIEQATGGKRMIYDSLTEKSRAALQARLDSAGQIPSSPGFSIPEGRDAIGQRTPLGEEPINPPFDHAKQAARASFDWRVYRSTTPVQDQGTCGACWAFATAALAENFYSVFYRRATTVSEQDIVNCATGGCGGGYLYNGLDDLENRGTASRAAVLSRLS